MSLDRDVLCLHLQTACIWEVLARKAGNVHRYRDFNDVGLCDFLLSAAAVAGPLSCTEQPLGRRIYNAIAATRNVCRSNTNLGIVLLLAPLAPLDYAGNWDQQLEQLLADAGVSDTEQVYAAIRLAQPAGLGRVAQEDVYIQPQRRLQQVMCLAAEQDLIARQYATNFADIRRFGLPILEAAWQRWGCIETAVAECQLHWLARFGDSLIARKAGPAASEQVQQWAREVLARGGLATPEGRQAYSDLDRRLRTPDHHLNPGTTADLIAATLFIALRLGYLSPAAPFSGCCPTCS
jgi:triphosphoribosyl-dephospho-CoA synthase